MTPKLAIVTCLALLPLSTKGRRKLDQRLDTAGEKATGAARLLSSDLSRARTRTPRREYRGKSHVEVPSTLNAILASTSGLATEACNEFTLVDLVKLKRTILASRYKELEYIYHKNNDSRRLGSFGRATSDHEELEDLWRSGVQLAETNAALYGHTRDAMCRDAVKLWVHHTSQMTKDELKHLVVIPLLPEMSTPPPQRDPALHRIVTAMVETSQAGLPCHSIETEPATAPVDPRVPTRPQLPPQFRIQFSMHDRKGSPKSHGTVFYDWPSRKQRVEHTANSSQCHYWYKTTDPCTEIFTPSGEVFILFPQNGSCCLESCAEGCKEQTTYLPRPDYVNFTEFAGYEVVDGYNCTRWNSQMLSWFTVDTQLPVMFSNGPQWGGAKIYALHYDVNSFQTVATDASMFVLPSECDARTLCGS